MRKIALPLLLLAFLLACSLVSMPAAVPSPQTSGTPTNNASPSPIPPGEESDATPTGMGTPTLAEDEAVASDTPLPETRSPLDPIPGDENMKRAQVFIDETQLLTLESYPPQFVLHVEGNLPTPCHELRAKIGKPGKQNQIQIELYSLVDPDTICAQVLSPFKTDLRLGSFDKGKYTVLVNGEQVGEIDSP